MNKTNVMSYEIKCQNPDDPYAPSIIEFIKREFPHLVARNDASRLNLVSEAILASGQVRYGPLPEPEQLVAIREVVAASIAADEPVPFLVGWGSEKPNGSGIDIAELFAVKTLAALAARVKEFYIPGIRVNIRVEDASAPHLFFDRQDAARREAAVYTQGFVNLIEALDFNHWLHAVPESSLVSERTFNSQADLILPLMEAHLALPSDQRIKDELAKLGFSQPITPDTMVYFMSRYVHLYPDKTVEQRRHILARYFSASVARRVLGITGASDKWLHGHLELSFVGPTPGIAPSRRRIYYRTMPSSITSNHMPAWRAKGYLRIGDSIKAALTTFDSKEFEWNHNVIGISNGKVTQEVNADYVLTK